MLNQPSLEISVFDSRISDAIKAATPKFDYLASSQVSRNDFRKIYSELITKYGESECKQLIQVFINYCIEYGRVNTEKLFQPIIKIPRASAPIHRENQNSIKSLKFFDQSFLNKIEEISSYSDNKLAAMILYSSIRYGLLLDKDLIRALSKSLCSKPFIHKDKLWFDLHIEPTATKKGSNHIWQPDSFTLCLLNIWYKKERKVNFNSWYRLIKITLDEREQLARNHHHFLKQMKNFLLLSYPSFIIEAKSKCKNNRGLEPESFLQQVTNTSPRLVAKTCPKQTNRNKKTPQADERLIQEVTIRLKKINSINSKPSSERNKLSLEINELTSSSDASNSAKSIAYCIAHYLTHKNRIGNSYKSKWLKRNLNQLTPKFSEAFNHQDPASLSDEERKQGYQSIINSCDNNQIPNMHRFIKDYHYYLHAAKGHGFNTKLLPKVTPIQYSAKGQIINEQQYQLILQWIERELKSSPSIEKAKFQSMKACLILGYRLGLRRSECMGLRTQDIHLAGRSEIIICEYQINNRNRYTLKSKSANRKIRLHHQMPDNELEYLLEYTKDRNTSSDNLFLIDWPKSHSKKNRTDFIFTNISKALRWVTGRPEARFHELRHSRATYKLWQCYLVAYDLTPQCHEQASEQQLDMIRKHLKFNFSPNWKANRHKILHYLAVEMGHASPATTLSNYIHSIDWIADELREKQLPRLKTKALSQLVALSRRRIQHIAKNQAKNHTTHYSGHSPSILRDNLLKQVVKTANTPKLDSEIELNINNLPSNTSLLQDTYLPEIRLFDAVKSHLTACTPIESLINIHPEFSSYIKPAVQVAKAKRFFEITLHRTHKQRATDKSRYLTESIISAYRNMYDQPNSKNLTRQQDRKAVQALAEKITDPEFYMAKASSGYNLFNKRTLQMFVKAVRVLNNYQAVGMPIQLGITLYSPSKVNSPARELAWSRWKKAITLPDKTIFIDKVISEYDSKNSTRFQALERIKVQVISENPVSPQNSEQIKSSYIFNSGFDTAMRVISLLNRQTMHIKHS